MDDESTNAMEMHIFCEKVTCSSKTGIIFGIKNSEISKKQELDLSEYTCFWWMSVW